MDRIHNINHLPLPKFCYVDLAPLKLTELIMKKYDHGHILI